MSEDNAPPEGAEFPETLPVLMLPDQVIFPQAFVPLQVIGEAQTKLINDAVMGHKFVGLLTARDAHGDDIGLDNAYEVGCIAQIMQMQRGPDGTVNVALRSLKRFRVGGLTQREPYLVVRVQPMDDLPAKPGEIAPLAATVKIQVSRFVSLSPTTPDEATQAVQRIEDPVLLADFVAGNMSIPLEEKQKMLESPDLKERFERLIYILASEIQLMEVSNKIQKDVKTSIDKGQREFYLRQQLKAIQEELGESEENRPELTEYRERIEALGLPEEVQKDVTRELNRLAQMNEASAEYHVIATYLDWIVELPWNEFTTDQLDIARAEAILDEDHYGLDKVKRRIIEYLAVRKLKPDASGPILCFTGPPGVGKTSLGRSIARALGRKFIRMSLGGVHDEAEIRGHRKTYVGALPGRIIQGIRKAGSRNPVFMLDEIDKIGSDFRGDPSSALLEVLDPAQNDSFSDHYLNVPFDLSKVLFIATANVLDTIPWALRDRMEMIELASYTVQDKLQIARRYLVPRQLEAHGVPHKKLSFTTPALRKIVTAYTREAGVRNLEREIANVCRGCARAFAEKRRRPIRIDPPDLRVYLGNERFHLDNAERTRVPGIAIGMAWTPVGGDILFVEATRMPGSGKMILTGQLGDVMKESARAVLSFVRSNAAKLGFSKEDFSEYDIHIHVPQGSVPKDGPSAGVTILTAIVSLLTGKRVKHNLAMTGEITLRGLVLPVGGVKEKVLAATRAGIKQIILPARCKNDLDEVPDSVKKRTVFHFVTRMHEVLEIALGIGNGE